ncbi:MAG: hypothetical protein CMJ45_07120 [Planctomyces sp.]|nr:hypothetical protein [Planctomyces sp.]
MRRRWITILAVAGLLAAAITGGAVMAQETGGEEAATSTPVPAPEPTTLLGRVAAILGLEEAAVEDAFQQARKDQRTEKYRAALDRKVEKGFITSEEADEQFLWFQSRPDSLAGSFRKGGQRQSAFGHARGFGGKRFGMRMHRRGGRWGGNNWTGPGSKSHDGQDSTEQEVAPTDPSLNPEQTDPDQTSQ